MKDLRDFISVLEKKGELVRLTDPINSYLELTEIQTRLLAQDGVALLCENVLNKDKTPNKHPVLINLFGSKRRFALGLNKSQEEIKELGELLAFLRSPKPPKNLKDAFSYLPIVKKVMNMSPNITSKAPSQEVVYLGDDINLDELPIQYCHPEDVAPLISWGIVVSHGPSLDNKDLPCEDTDDYNLGIYRMQKLSKNKLIMRWLAHRGGAQQFLKWKQKFPNTDMPICVAIGVDPSLTIAAVTPVPDNLSEYKFAGLLSDKKVDLVKSKTNNMLVPAYAEIILEGYVSHNEVAKEGPYGDHTGYYNEVEEFPVFNLTAITTRKNPIYLSTFTSRPPDEPSILAECLNDMFVPFIKQQFPEIHDFYLPADACSYRMAFVSIKKSYAGQAKRVMMGVWSYLRQFMYTKFIVVVDDDMDVRNLSDILWAISTNVDPARDSMIVENTPIDYLDFASPVSGLGSKMGIDATAKIYPETNREWGRRIFADENTKKSVDILWDSLQNILKK
ncbi:MAG: UbiD family decarboxylase [Alphaproteobacteria bacterium]|jgi:4-hydroxy-3-polyprenylbenzoate decarboxylase|nr:UbiD family decarboxylase [Alphaproteobacteria bacterium]